MSPKKHPGCFDHSSPSSSIDSSPPWYRASADDSISEENAQKEADLDLLTAASTPLHVHGAKSALFNSPLQKLDRLHLSSSMPLVDNLAAHTFSHSQFSHSMTHSREHVPVPRKQISTEGPGLGSDGSDSSQYAAGDRTVVAVSESDDDNHSVSSRDDPLSAGAPPVFVRKRRHTDSPADMILTPNYSSEGRSSSARVVSEDMSGVIGNDTTESLSKISFSASDSTPCPPQPRKRLKFKNSLYDTTPSQPSKVGKPILNLTSSKKLSASDCTLLGKLNNATSEQKDFDSLENTTSSSSRSYVSKNNASSTPISQSTPANSRSGSPALFAEDSAEEVNGYKFVKPTTTFKYETPQTRPISATPHSTRNLLNAYNSNNLSSASSGRYQIVGNFPVTAAGLMDEDGDDVHIADKRINDPYLGLPSTPTHESKLLETYLASHDRLPLLSHFESNLCNEEMRILINDGVSVLSFYKHVLPSDWEEPNESVITFLKKERLRWHPDKWEGKIENSSFEKATIDNLSQVLNALIESVQRESN